MLELVSFSNQKPNFERNDIICFAFFNALAPVISTEVITITLSLLGRLGSNFGVGNFLG